MSVTPEQWFKSLGTITKVYFLGCVGTVILTSLGIVNPMWLYLDYKLVFGKFQIWRLFTCFFYFGKLSFFFVMVMRMMTRYFDYLEKEHFGEFADLVYLLIFSISSFWVVNAIYPIYFYGSSLVVVGMYVWSRKVPYGDVDVWGFKLKRYQYPFAFLGLSFLMGGSIAGGIVGILVGHLYVWLKEIVPNERGWNLLNTPRWLIKFLDRFNSQSPNRGWASRSSGHRLR